jgi:hypothetical protein
VAVAIVALAADENVLCSILLAVARTPHGEHFIVVYEVVAALVKNTHSIFSSIPLNAWIY